MNFLINILVLKTEFASLNDLDYTWVKFSNNRIKIMMQDFYETKKEIPNFPDDVNSSNLIVLKYDNIDEIKNI